MTRLYLNHSTRLCNNIVLCIYIFLTDESSLASALESQRVMSESSLGSAIKSQRVMCKSSLASAIESQLVVMH